MGSVLGDVLTLAVGIAVSPMPLIAVILLLLSEKAATASTGFVLGWLAGIVATTTIALAVVGATQGHGSTGPSTLSSVLKLTFGVLLLAVAVKQWRSRPEPGDVAVMPKWMAKTGSMTFLPALGIGALLAALNPKNLIMELGAGTTIGGGQLSVGGDVVAVAVFTALAGSTVAAPVIAYLVARERMTGPLSELRAWLTQNNAAVMASVMLVVGVGLIGKAISGLSS